MGIPERVHDLLAPIVDTLDVELLDVEWNGTLLRLVVERPDASPADRTSGISTDQLAAVNRLVSPILDQHDPVPGRYTLEVSSPGVERKLHRPEHFQRAIGEVVVVKQFPGNEPRRLKGSLVASDDQSITVEAIEIDGVDQADPEPHRIELTGVSSARTSFDWGPTPKKGGSGKGRSKQRTAENRKTRKDPS